MSNARKSERRPRHHTIILSPPDRTQPEGFENRHHTDWRDEKLIFDKRCPLCRFDNKDKVKS
jgi:hypothetical protein